MQNIKLTVSYDGTDYAGWQVQRNAKTIQAEIEKALKKILKEKVRLTGAGRTDSGVHAEAQVTNFITKSAIPPEKIRPALNSHLPDDISVMKAENAAPDFHSQFDAKSKVYRYAILQGSVDIPFSRRYYHRVPPALDIALMAKEARSLIGRHDFKAFQAKSALSPIRDTARTVKNITVRKKKDFIYIDIEADGFLHNMVRNIVGTMIEIGRGYFPEGSMKRIMLSRDRRTAGPTAPAKGLILIKVKYR